MKKIAIVLAVLLFAAPAMAVVTITATQVGSTDEVTITYVTSGEGGKLPRAFALDITVDSGRTITGISNFFTGECNDSNGFGIFPGSFKRYIDADDPNWADVNYSPVAAVADLPGDTQPGIDFNGITIEMGSLYASPKGPPPGSGTLCSINVSCDCTVSLALNIGRGKVVMEDGNEPNGVVLNGVTVTGILKPVPNVVDDANLVAQAAIVAAGFTVGNITTACSDSIAAGNVISTNPAGGVPAGCGASVDIVVSDGQPTVPNVVDMTEAAATSAIGAVDYISVGTVSYDCSGSIVDGNVISTTPSAGVVSCSTTVDILVSKGPPPTVPNVLDMNEADAIAAINAVANLSVGSVTDGYHDTEPDGNVISQTPGAGAASCDATVDLVISKGQACLSTGAVGFALWLSNNLQNEPNCWCYDKQCRGDTDGKVFLGKPVSLVDWNLVKAAFNKLDGAMPAGGICTDLDHKKFLNKHCTLADFNIAKGYFNDLDATVPVCDAAPVITGPYNFWKIPPP